MNIELTQKEPMDLKLAQINNPKVWTFRLADEPEILIVIDSSHEGMVHYFWEDAFQTEPRLGGITTCTKEDLESKHEIKLT
jgi:hypothetical protein